jgi:hypothetical protein
MLSGWGGFGDADIGPDTFVHAAFSLLIDVVSTVVDCILARDQSGLSRVRPAQWTPVRKEPAMPAPLRELSSRQRCLAA